jgi:glyoxylase-like metal-dependent hydrolase (beta-lactamase superfamily II)
MKLKIIDTGNLMCDGGAMFGSVPKVLWQKQYPCNADNYCNLSMRALLIDIGDRVFLIDNGCGDKQSKKYYSYFHLNGEGSLLGSLRKAGYKPEDITDMVLTHLHFDHCGGGVKYNHDRTRLELTFPNATYWAGKTQWENYLNPNVREGDAYFKEDMMPVFEAGRLKLVECDCELAPGISVRIFNGHTPGQILPFIRYDDKTLVYMGDLIPVAASVPIPWVSAYDSYPVTSMKEKELFLNEAVDKGYILFFEHDLTTECCTVVRSNKRFKPLLKGSLTSFIND